MLVWDDRFHRCAVDILGVCYISRALLHAQPRREGIRTLPAPAVINRPSADLDHLP